MCSTSNTGRWNNRCVTGKMISPMNSVRAKFSSIALAIALVVGASFGPAISRSLAADVSVSARLTRPQINFGEMAELQVTVTGASRADVPQEIPVEGLQIRLTGQSTQVQMINFKVTSSAVYSYIVLPLRTGRFTVPTVPVSADGRQFRTASLPFTVTDPAVGGGASPATAGLPQQQQQMIPPMPGFSQRQVAPPRPQENGRVAFGEISCPKKTIYAGEMVPVEIRYYFDARYPVQIRGKVDFGSEGILVERFPDPKEGREERDGITYNVLSFRTLLSAVKPGVIDIPAAKIDSEIQMPGGMPAGFDDPVFRQLLGGQSPFVQARQLAVKTAPLHLEVLQLPKEGRPISFAGAVGQFDIDAAVPNPRVAPGDPALLNIKIGGKGNFKAMGAPVLIGTEGWRSYPPSDKFDSTDELSYTGVKSFGYTLIAQEEKHQSPGAEFSYFDPINAKYVTLTMKPLPLEASPGSGGGAAAVTSAPASPTVTQPQPTPPEAVVSPGDPIPGITLHSWWTPAHRPGFTIISLLLLLAAVILGGILYFVDLQARGGTASSRRKRRLAGLLSSLTERSLDAASAYEAALEYAELVAPPSEKRESLIAGLIQRRDALKYGIGGTVALTVVERSRLLESLRDLSKN